MMADAARRTRPCYNPSDYAYATGCVKVRERAVLRREWYEKLADSAGPAEVAAVLREVPYLELPPDPSLSPSTIERGVSGARAQVHHFLAGIAPDPYLPGLLFAHHDFAWTKREMAAAALETGRETRAPRFFLGAVGTFPDPLGPALATLSAKLMENYDLAAFEEAADRAFYAWLVSEARDTGIKFLALLVRRIVDAENVRLLLRHRALYHTPTFAGFLPGGEIEAERFTKAYPREERDIGALLADTPFAGAEVAFSVEQPYAASLAERCIDDGITGAARPARRGGAGVEPLLGYAIGMETELRNIQAVGSGAAARVPPDVLKKRIREPYV